MTYSVRLPYGGAVILVLCLLVPGCGKKQKLTKANFDKIYDAMTLKEVQAILGKGEELSATPRTAPSGSGVGAAAGIDMPSTTSEAPTLLPRIHFGLGNTVMQWEEGDRLVQMVFVNEKMKVKEKKGF
jgi:hypothetical protein